MFDSSRDTESERVMIVANALCDEKGWNDGMCCYQCVRRAKTVLEALDAYNQRQLDIAQDINESREMDTEAIATVINKISDWLLNHPDVNGVAVTQEEGGSPALLITLLRGTTDSLPSSIDGVKVTAHVVGNFKLE